MMMPGGRNNRPSVAFSLSLSHTHTRAQFCLLSRPRTQTRPLRTRTLRYPRAAQPGCYATGQGAVPVQQKGVPAIPVAPGVAAGSVPLGPVPGAPAPL
jgi:hypothetical protein